jgi:3-deoxy-D-manno-octulosonate 8-phosphate phosphatase (KDO 8-P phosphatase)
MNILEKFKAITTFVFDMDGVLTDGTLLIMPDGEWIRQMHIRDGYALQLAVKKGYHVCIITGSWSEPVKDRLIRLGITDIFQRVSDKVSCLETYMQEKGLKQEEVLYMGDDMPDFEVLQIAGLGSCPADAVPDIRELSVYISPEKGGHGCVRDVIEKVLRLNNHWNNSEGTRSL